MYKGAAHSAFTDRLPSVRNVHRAKSDSASETAISRICWFSICRVFSSVGRVRIVDIDRRQDTLVGLPFLPFDEPDRAWTLTQQVHIIAAEQPVQPCRLFRSLDHQIVSIAQHLANDFQETGAIPCVRCNRDPLTIRIN